MNKKKYLAELAGLLSFLDETERSLVIEKLDERFDTAGEGNEIFLITELGTPMQLAISLNRNGIESITGDIEPIEELVVPTVDKSEEVVEAEEETVEVEETVEEEDSSSPAPLNDEVEEVSEKSTTESLIDSLKSEETIDDVAAAIADDDVKDCFPELEMARGITNEIENKPENCETSVLGAIAFGFISVLFGIPLMVLSLALCISVFIPVAALANFSAYGVSAGVASLFYIPDAMLVFGIAFAMIGMTALILILALAIVRLVVVTWVSSSSWLFIKLVRKGAK